MIILYCIDEGMVKILNLLLGSKLKGVISRTINTDIPIRYTANHDIPISRTINTDIPISYTANHNNVCNSYSSITEYNKLQ